jgi:hemerythrin
MVSAYVKGDMACARAAALRSLNPSTERPITSKSRQPLSITPILKDFPRCRRLSISGPILGPGRGTSFRRQLMPIAAWTDSYKVGHPQIDLQHQELFRIVNGLHDAIVDGKGREILGSTLLKLAACTVNHFKTEEAVMSSVQYPGLDAHKRKHEALAAHIKDLAKKCASGEMVFTTSLSSFLSDWLRNHVKEDDMAASRYMKANRGAAVGRK